MTKLLRSLLALVMAFAVSAQGLAASLMGVCGPAHQHAASAVASTAAAPFGPGPQHPADGHGGHDGHVGHASHDGHDDPLGHTTDAAPALHDVEGGVHAPVPGQADGMGHPASSSCSVCAACCAMAALPVVAAPAPLSITTQPAPVAGVVMVTSPRPGRLERPPRTVASA